MEFKVIELERDQIEPPPKIGTQLKTDFVKGMGKKDDRFVIILEIDNLFSSEELAEVQGNETEGRMQRAGNE